MSGISRSPGWSRGSASSTWAQCQSGLLSSLPRVVPVRIPRPICPGRRARDVMEAEYQPIEYSARNHPLDSKSVARPGYELSDERLIEFAERTAREMADKFGIPMTRSLGTPTPRKIEHKNLSALTKHESDVNIVLRRNRIYCRNEKRNHRNMRGCRDLLRQRSARAGSSWRRLGSWWRVGRRWLVGTGDRRWGHRRCVSCSVLCRSCSVLCADLCTGTDLRAVVVV